MKNKYRAIITFFFDLRFLFFTESDGKPNSYRGGRDSRPQRKFIVDSALSIAINNQQLTISRVIPRHLCVG